MDTSYTNIGTILKPHGVHGELKIQVDDPYIDDFLRASLVFLEVQGHKAPFFIDQKQKRSARQVKFEEINAREEATKLFRKEIYLREEDLSVVVQEKAPEDNFDLLIGFTIEDREKGRLGEIEEVLELPQQWMAVVSYAGKELLIPINETFILEIDPEERVVFMDLPEGLLEL